MNVINQMDDKIYEMCCAIVVKMLKQEITELSLKGYIDDAQERERIIINQTLSPDGARGAFLLLKRSRFEPVVFESEQIEKELGKLIEENDNFQFSNESGLRIQDFFEEETFRKLIQIFGEKNVKKACSSHMNEYDFIIFCDNFNFLLEVKSDRWVNTGNISLEIIRDIEKYKGNYTKMCRDKFNIGSIIKTRANYWLIFYYDIKKKIYYTKIYQVFQIKKFVYNLIERLHQKYVACKNTL